MRPLPDGYEIRPPTFDDVEGVAEVLLADDLADVGESDIDADFVRDQWSAPGVDLSEDAWGSRTRTRRSSPTRTSHPTARTR